MNVVQCMTLFLYLLEVNHIPTAGIRSGRFYSSNRLDTSPSQPGPDCTYCKANLIPRTIEATRKCTRIYTRKYLRTAWTSEVILQVLL